MSSPWYKWPEDKYTGRVAWYTILRRVTCYPFVAAAVAVLFIALLCGWGYDTAERTCKNIL